MVGCHYWDGIRWWGVVQVESPRGHLVGRGDGHGEVWAREAGGIKVVITFLYIRPNRSIEREAQSITVGSNMIHSVEEAPSSDDELFCEDRIITT